MVKREAAPFWHGMGMQDKGHEMGMMWTDDLVGKSKALLGQKVVKRRRAGDWSLAADLGVRTPRQHWVLYLVCSAMFLLSFGLLVVSLAEGAMINILAFGFVAVVSCWLVLQLGDTVGLGPEPDQPGQGKRTLEELVARGRR